MPLQHGELKITESKFYRISGDSTQHRGVIPDLKFPAIYDVERVGESTLDDALPWDAIAPARHKFYFEITSMLPELNKNHRLRMAEDPDFIYLNDQLALREILNTKKSISLNEKERQQQEADSKQQQLMIENKRRKTKGLELLTSIDDKDKSTNVEDVNHGNKNDDNNDNDNDDDIYLTESGYILIDTMNILQR
jgi:carboxyl-terminal processing protease